jgi:hypothetical protein
MRATATIAWRASVCFRRCSCQVRCSFRLAATVRDGSLDPSAARWQRPLFVHSRRTPRGRCAAVPQLEALL